MARRGFFKKSRRAFRRASGGFKRYGRKAVTSSNPIKVILPAMAYGAGRNWLTQIATPITSKIPLGNYADEVAFGLLGYYIAKKNPMGLKNVGLAILTVESASVGNQLVGQFGAGSSNTTAWGNQI
jgi:hypothetical protein